MSSEDVQTDGNNQDICTVADIKSLPFFFIFGRLVRWSKFHCADIEPLIAPTKELPEVVFAGFADHHGLVVSGRWT